MKITNQLLHNEPDLPRRMRAERQDHGSVTMSLTDGEKELRTRAAIVNMLLWYPLIRQGVPIRLNDIFEFGRTLNNKKISEVNTHVYHKLTSETDLDKDSKLQLIWESMNYLETVITTQMAEFHQTIDAIGLNRIREHPEVKKIINLELKDSEGSAAAEKKLADGTQRLMELLGDPDALPENQLLALQCSGNIKPGQLPQIFIAYGPRDDIDGSIKKHIVKESSISGCKSVKDYAVEALAAKKATYLSQETIRYSQALGRRLRLAGSPISHVYSEWCGNTMTVPFRITDRNKKYCLYNTIMEDNVRRVLLSDNINEYVDTWVDLVSPITCRYTDGFCNTCAGWGYGMASEYMPNVLVGMYAMTRFISKASQSVLSTKHEDSTDSAELTLNESAARYFRIREGVLWLTPQAARRKNLYLRIRLNDMHPLTDLQEDYSNIVSSFSEIGELGIVDKNGKFVDEFTVGTSKNVPYLSKAVLDNMRRMDLPTDERYCYLPFTALPTAAPVMQTNAISDTMAVYVKQLKGWFKNNAGFRSYTAVPEILQDFSEFVHSEMDLNIFYVQLILRAYMLDESGSGIPLVRDINNVRFGDEDQVFKTRSISLKLAYGAVPDWLKEVQTFVQERGPSVCDDVFGIGL